MENKGKIFKKLDGLNPKLNICYFSTLMQPINEKNNNTNPIYELLSNFEEIQKISQIKDLNILKFFYFNRHKTHQILYDFEKLITINDKDKEEIKLIFYLYFYLCLLIEENSNLVNYKYSFNLIKNINELQNMENDKVIKKIILAKIIIDLITNYEQSCDNDEIINDYSLNNIKSSNLEIIKSNANIYKEFNLQENDIISMKIDEIYAKIIKTLIINKKLEQSEYIYNIIAQLGLESINITNTIFNELSNILDKNKDYMKEYIIREYEDLFNIKLMTFYYFLMKYILKCNVYIYKIPFLLETRNNIKKLIRDNLEKFCDSIKNIKNLKK